MPIGRITFNLADPDDRNEHRVALEGHKYLTILQNMDEWLRQKIKHGNFKGKEYQMLVDIRNYLHDELTDRGINLHE